MIEFYAEPLLKTSEYKAYKSLQHTPSLESLSASNNSKILSKRATTLVKEKSTSLDAFQQVFVKANLPSDINVASKLTRVVNAIVVEGDESKILALSKLPSVKRIVKSTQVKKFLSESVPMIGADQVWQKKDPQGNNVTGR